MVRLLRQAERDFIRETKPVYDIARLAPTPFHFLAHVEYLRGAVLKNLFHCIWWHNTPQGAEWWQDYFRQPVSVRDKTVLEDLIAAFKRASRLKGGTDG